MKLKLRSCLAWGFSIFLGLVSIEVASELASNASLAKVAKEEGVTFGGEGGEVLEPHYGESDFIDNGHLSRSGNKLLANAMTRVISRSHVSDGRKTAP